MRRKILITFFIISLILGFYYTKVFAETNVKETVYGRFTNYDIIAEHKLEIKDNMFAINNERLRKRGLVYLLYQYKKIRI